MPSRGTIDTYTLKNGTERYRARIDVRSDKDGRNRKSKVFGSRQAAQLWLNKLSTQQITAVDVEPSDKPLKEFLEEWIDYLNPENSDSEGVNTNGVAYSTFGKYKQNVENHLIPTLGTVPLGELSVGLVQDFIDCQLQNGRLDDEDKQYSVSTIKSQVGTLRTALKQAKKINLIRENPAKFDRLNFPVSDTRDRKSLSPEQAEDFIKAANEIETYQPLYTVALLTGLRRSELLGLTWDKIDLHRGVLSVEQKLISDPSSGKLLLREKTKTSSSNREVKISDEVVEVLSKHNEDQWLQIEQVREENWKGFWKNKRLVFTNETNGNWIYPTNINRVLNQILDEANLPMDFQFHDLRSSYITLMHHLELTWKKLVKRWATAVRISLRKSIDVRFQEYRKRTLIACPKKS